jgi:hypothetical protein
MTRLSHDVRAQAVGLALITLATGAAFWVGEGLEGALPPFLILLAFSVFVLVGRTRSDAVRAMSGVGDERTRSLYERSVAFAGTVVSFAVPTWWLVTVARGEPNDTLAAVAALFGASFVLGAVVLSRRS